MASYVNPNKPQVAWAGLQWFTLSVIAGSNNISIQLNSEVGQSIGAFKDFLRGIRSQPEDIAYGMERQVHTCEIATVLFFLVFISHCPRSFSIVSNSRAPYTHSRTRDADSLSSVAVQSRDGQSSRGRDHRIASGRFCFLCFVPRENFCICRDGPKYSGISFGKRG